MFFFNVNLIYLFSFTIFSFHNQKNIKELKITVKVFTNLIIIFFSISRIELIYKTVVQAFISIIAKVYLLPRVTSLNSFRNRKKRKI